MEFKEFKEILESAIQHDDQLQHYSNILKFDHDIFQFGWILLDKIWFQNFSEEGVDWINWWLWERMAITGEELPWYDEEGNKRYAHTIEDLWGIVKEYQL